MELKYVYVLTSSEKDYYYEQCLVSVMSLRKYNDNCEIIIITDDITAKQLRGFRGKIKHYAEVKEVVCEKKYNQKIRSRILKSSMRKIVDGDFLFLDLDTVIVGSLQEIEHGVDNIGMVLDKHEKVTKRYMYKNMYMNAERMGYRTAYEDKHFNSGVILVRDTQVSHDFFDLWNRLYFECLEKGIDIDQTSLNEANCRMCGVIEEMNGIWNVQVNSGLKYISEAKIFHYLGYQPLNKQNKYFNSLPFLLCDEKLFHQMRMDQFISNDILEIIENPKRSFKSVTIIPEDCVAHKILYSNHFRILKFIYVKFNKLFFLMEKIYGSLFSKLFGRM